METMLELTGLPFWYVLVLVAILGAVMASFVNVVAYRLHTNATLSGRSRCFACGHTLVWYELIPIVSYLLQAGRCRQCHARIPVRDFLIEIVGAGLYMAMALAFSDVVVVVLSWLLVSTLLTIAVYDLDHFIIPNELVVVVGLLGLVYFGYTHWPITGSAVLSLGWTVLTAAGFYAGLWKVSGGRWLGFGDVKLAASLAPFLSVAAAFSTVVLSFWVGAAIGGGLVIVAWLQRRWQQGARANGHTRLKSEIPFAPFIVGAFLIVYTYGVDVLGLFTL